MFTRQPDSSPLHAVSDHFLDSASADHLTALAFYFEAEARRLRTAAAAIRRTEKFRRLHQHDHEPARRVFLAHGAKVALLIRRGMTAKAAYSAVRAQSGLTADVLQAALATWRQQRRKMLGMGNDGR